MSDIGADTRPGREHLSKSLLIGADGGFFRGPDDLVRVTYALRSSHVLRLELLRGRARMIRDIHPARQAAVG